MQHSLHVPRAGREEGRGTGGGGGARGRGEGEGQGRGRGEGERGIEERRTDNDTAGVERENQDMDT